MEIRFSWPGHAAYHGDGDGSANRAKKSGHVGEGDFLETWAQHDQDADKADCDGAPAPPANMFAEKQRRDDGGECRSKKYQRVCFGKFKMGEGVNCAQPAGQAGCSSNIDLQLVGKLEGIAPFLMFRFSDDDRYGGKQGDEKADFKDRYLTANRFDQGVAECIKRIGGQGNQYAFGMLDGHLRRYKSDWRRDAEQAQRPSSLESRKQL